MVKGCFIIIAICLALWLVLIVLGILSYFGLTSLAPV